jgi:hypothetical protein
MPGMSKSSRTVRLIESSLLRLEVQSESGAAGDAAVYGALGVLEEIRLLERKWREQVAAGSPRRIDSDFATMNGWYRRWLLAAKRLSAQPGDLADRLREACVQVERSV